jgi:ankyrin repeat protein
MPDAQALLQLERQRPTWRRRIAILAMVTALASSGAITSVGMVSATSDDPDDADLDRALIEAAWRDDVGSACDLILGGADVNTKDATEQSAYLVSTSEGYLELLELTLANGADVASLDSYQGTGLIRSAERGHWQVVGRLLQTDIDVDHINRLGWTALHEAIILGDGSQDYVDTVRLLVAGGVDVELATGRGELPLELATSRGQQDVVATLVRAATGLPTEISDEALLDAASDGGADGAAIALRHGAQVDATNANGSTAREVALGLGHDDVVRMLDALATAPPSDAGCPAQ